MLLQTLEPWFPAVHVDSYFQLRALPVSWLHLPEDSQGPSWSAETHPGCPFCVQTEAQLVFGSSFVLWGPVETEGTKLLLRMAFDQNGPGAEQLL